MKKLILMIFIILLMINVNALIKGDVNNDGKVNTQDYLLVKKHILGTSKLTGDNLVRADVNQQNGVTSLDYIAIKKIILNGSVTVTTTPLPATTSSKTEEKIHFIKVDSSDATLIESNGKYGLIDVSNPFNTGNKLFDDSIGNGTMVLKYLQNLGVTHLEFIIASHPHSDHIGGIPELVNNSTLVDSNTTFIHKQFYKDDSPYGEIVMGYTSNFENIDYDWKTYEFLELAKSSMSKKGATLLETASHTSSNMNKLNASFVNNSDKWMQSIKFKMGDLTFNIYNLYPYTQVYNGKTYIDVNSNSLVVLVTASNGKKAYFSGDMNVRGSSEYYYASRIGKVDILKANHHGHQWSNSAGLITSLKPNYFVVPGKSINDMNHVVSAHAYVNSYGGKVYYSGYAPSNVNNPTAIVINLGSSISVSESDTKLTSSHNGWYHWLNNNETLYFTYIKNGKMIFNDWILDKGKWYYLNSNGMMAYNQWIKNKEKWYYLGSDGAMYSGRTATINGNSYTFDNSGACVAGC